MTRKSGLIIACLAGVGYLAWRWLQAHKAQLAAGAAVDVPLRDERLVGGSDIASSLAASGGGAGDPGQIPAPAPAAPLAPARTNKVDPTVAAIARKSGLTVDFIRRELAKSSTPSTNNAPPSIGTVDPKTGKKRR